MIYVTYDGIGEPLGQSQVLSYVARLVREFDITLISFEKSDVDVPRLRAQLRRLSIEWIPLRYHKAPPILSTMFDLLAGHRALVRSARRRRPAIVHVRSYVPAFIALFARRRTDGRLLFDIRGFWADERVEGGLWPVGGVLYRIAKRCERRFFAEADAVVTLTAASVPQIREWAGDRSLPIEVIPTCVEITRFGGRPERPGGPRVIWSGSIGTWYRFELAASCAKALSMPLTVLTRQVELARDVLAGFSADVRSVEPDRIPHELFRGDVGLCLIARTFSKVASTPTRFAEYLAAGMPVLITPGVGDLEELVHRHRVGIVLRDDDSTAIEQAARELRDLIGDPEMSDRCQRLAREMFDVTLGAARYAELYAKLIAPP